ncbi:tRNA (adenosine(37)-N6)-dimethylallyltransferase MiaA [Sediminibacillus dalangtanensis]|uniref:tRNA dimethylallyltransferase n=1 Tax=Sediminibacillus dalangtanensis TaxID=2729421 RepID=A0ABX7VUN0_9BACI|nr:tRNA (adenosine(37)-N6)-dimethylallyltransferase MiaA [Sediminibacillus dalangtanensis]QTM99490.1 tRNA (adenosine(37)-N6)-dimethylallyltransferase MiaA [Sediminibacillus dalangtanensis]
MKPVVVAVVGPTAVGKTSLSVEIGRNFSGEVISGDSMQIYRGMDIGTAKITKEETKGVPHHMIDIKQPGETFSVAEFQQKVADYVREITERNHLPIIAGGTGLYIQAALNGYIFADEKRDDTFHAKLEKDINQYGIDSFYAKLQRVDPEQAEKIHPNNKRRVIRALEVYEKTGKTMSEYQAGQKGDSPYRPIIIGLEMERDLLYQRINERVDVMIETGLVEEVKNLYNRGFANSQSMKAIGYKEIIPYLKGEMTLDEAVDLLKRNSRRFAKRQLTWFKNKMDIHWYTIKTGQKEEQFEIILSELAGMLKKK